MAQAKVSIQSLLSMVESLRQGADSILQYKSEMDNHLRSFVWNDPIGQSFTVRYEDDFKPLTTKLIPAIDDYIHYIEGLEEFVDEYSGATNTTEGANLHFARESFLGTNPRASTSIMGDNEDKSKTVAAILGVGGALSAMWFWLHDKLLGTNQVHKTIKDKCDVDCLKEIELFLGPDELFSKESLDTFHRVAEDSHLPQDRKSFYEMDKEQLIASLQGGLSAEDRRNPLKDGRPNFVTIKNDYRKGIGDSTHGYHYTDDGNEVIWINPTWYKKKDVDNLDVLGTVMHEYEHKIQHDKMLRGQISEEAYKHYHYVSKECQKQFDSHIKITNECREDYRLYYDNWQEVRSRKAAEIAQEAYLNSFKPKVLYRNN